MSKYEYKPTTWIGGKTIGTADVMNNIEDGIIKAHERLDNIGDISSGGGNVNVDLSDYATKEELTTLENNLSNCATKDELTTLEKTLNEHLENHPSGVGSNNWQEIWVEDITLNTPVRSISKDIDKSLKQFSEVIIYANFSANTNTSVTTTTTFKSLNFGGMSFLYFSVAQVTSTQSKNVFITLDINPYKSYSEKVENINSLEFNSVNLVRMLSGGGSVNNNKITIDSNNDYTGTISLKIYGR